MTYLRAIAIFFNDFFAVVRTAIVKDDDFKVLESLIEYGIKTLPKIRRVIVVRDYDGNERHVF